MSNKLNTNIAKALDMEVPPEINDDDLPMEIDPTALVKVDSPNLPDMTDIDIRLLEGEHQLDTLISSGMAMFKEMQEGLETVDPKFRNRHMEIVTMAFSQVLAAVKHKNDLQLKKKDTRMNEQSFAGGGQKSNENGTVVNNFFGTREAALELIQDAEDSLKRDMG